MAIQIDIKRSGFPVKIGTVELWFDSSVENLARFFDIDKEVNDRFNEYQKDLVERSNAGEFDELKDGTVNTAVVDEAVKLDRKMTEIKYDLLFGDGTFAKLYEAYPDYQALDDAFASVDELIGAELDEMAAERKKTADSHAAKFVAKSKAKKAKKK